MSPPDYFKVVQSSGNSIKTIDNTPISDVLFDIMLTVGVGKIFFASFLKTMCQPNFCKLTLVFCVLLSKVNIGMNDQAV